LFTDIFYNDAPDWTIQFLFILNIVCNYTEITYQIKSSGINLANELQRTSMAVNSLYLVIYKPQSNLRQLFNC